MPRFRWKRKSKFKNHKDTKAQRHKEGALPMNLTAPLLCAFVSLWLKELAHGGVPLPLCLQDQLDYFPDRAAAAGSAGHVSDASQDLGAGVRDSDGKAHTLQDRQILKIVPDVADPVGGNFVFLQHFFKGSKFPLSEPLVKDIHFQILRTLLEGGCAASGDDSGFDAGLACKDQPRAVGYIEHLGLDDASAGNRHVEQCAVREHTVHIHQQQLDPRRERCQVLFKHRRIATSCSRRAGNNERFSALGPSDRALAGFSWTSMNRPSTPAATPARAR